ncbi:MAG: AbrB/MazE/SpoVT family DNA-binding domain-containing protein [Nanoarchaeota archaeon]
MKVQKQLSKRRGSKVYHKYVIVIPEETMQGSGFKEGDELEAESKKGEIRLRKK